MEDRITFTDGIAIHLFERFTLNRFKGLGETTENIDKIKSMFEKLKKSFCWTEFRILPLQKF